MRRSLILETDKMGIKNLSFPGGASPEALAEQFRTCSLFVLLHAEGVPKVAQEAAACGLPIVLNGFYEARSQSKWGWPGLIRSFSTMWAS